MTGVQTCALPIYNFGMFPRATRQFAATAAMFKALEPKPETYSVIFNNDAFSKTAAEGVKLSCNEAGFKMLDSFELPTKVSDASSVLASVRAKTPDMLLCVVHDQDSLLIARQMVATNTNVKLLYQGLGPQLASYREALGKHSESIYCSTYWDEAVTYPDKFFGSAKKFAEYYRSKFTRPIAYHVSGAAACIEAYVLAMQAAKSVKPEAVRDAVHVEVLVGHRAALGERRCAERLDLLLEPAGADAEHQPAVRQHVDRGQHLGG